MFINRRHEQFDLLLEFMCMLSPTPAFAIDLRDDLELSHEQFKTVVKQAEQLYGIKSIHLDHPKKTCKNKKIAYYIDRPSWRILKPGMDVYMDVVYGK